MSVLVAFKGSRFWYLGNSLSNLDHALVYPQHCNASGDVFSYSASFAHVTEDGKIMRYGCVIGSVAELSVVETCE